MKICIYGAGAMGTSLGWFLSDAPVDKLDLVTRNAAHVAALNEGAALVGFEPPQSLHALLPEEMKERYDVIFLATKQRENAAIARFLKDYLVEDGALVTVQNGLPEAGLAEVLGADRVYGCTLGWGAETISPGVIRLTSAGERHLAVGAYGRGERLEEIAELFKWNFSVTVGNLAEIRYSKLVVNAAFSTLSAISGLTFGELAKRHKRLVLSLMREVIEVALAAGCKKLIQNGHDILKLFKGPFASLILPVAMKKHRDITSGMLRDIAAGRRCDVDFVAGAVVAAGAKMGVPCPRLTRAISLLHDIENGLAELSPESLKLL